MTLQLEIIQSYILYGIWLLISVPTICYMSYQLKQNWNEPWLLRRRRPLILIICVLLFYIIGIECPSYTISYISPKNILTTNIYAVILTISMVVKFWAASFILLRIYLLYYDHEYNRTVSNNKWKILINSRQLTKYQSWFLANRQRKYGDEDWIIWHILVPITLLFSIFYVAIRFALISHLNIFDNFEHPVYYAMEVGAIGIWALAIISIGTFFWRKYPKFADIWLIRREITISLILILVVLLQFIIFVAINILFQIGIIIFSILTSVMLYIMIIYPQTAVIRSAKAMKNKITALQELDVSWEEVVSTKEGYVSFMNFLEKELSTENLLFVTEYVQLKTVMMSKETLVNKMENELKLKYHLKLPNGLPMSTITQSFIYEINRIDMKNMDKVNGICWEGLHKIYDRYINEELADLEVNISSKRRRDITKVYENESVVKTVDNIITPMEKCVMEISSLLNDSRSRFCEEIVFTELAVAISKTKSGSKEPSKRIDTNETETVGIKNIPSKV